MGGTYNPAHNPPISLLVASGAVRRISAYFILGDQAGGFARFGLALCVFNPGFLNFGAILWSSEVRDC